MAKMKWFDWTALVLLTLGGLNWGLVGFFNYNLVEAVFGNLGFLKTLIYDVVGLSAIFMPIRLLLLKK